MGRSGAAAAVTALAAALGGPAAAHPHAFVDAGVELRFDAAGHLAALRIVWVYDEFTSMLLLADLGLTPGPGDRLAEPDRVRLQGFDMRWDPGFAGDTHLAVAEARVPLGPPHDWTADYVQGRIVTSHVRALAAPVDPAAAPVTVQLYDPTYFTAYTIATDPVIAGRAGCSATVWDPDLAAASARLEAALAALAGSGIDPETAFPAVGAAFAEVIRLACPAPS